MDSDPRIKEITHQIDQLNKKIKQQMQIVDQASLIRKWIEWKKLKNLRIEQENKVEFKEKLRNKILSRKDRKNRKNVRKNIKKYIIKY